MIGEPMSTRDLVNAIVAGDAASIEVAFQSVMAEKISDSLESYRQEVAKSMFKTEEVQQIDELSKGTLASYYSKAIGDRHSKDLARDSAKRKAEPDEKEVKRLGDKIANRSSGLEKAKTKFFSKEEVELDEEQLDELDKLAMRGMFSADPKSKQHIGVTTEKGKAARAKANLPVLKQVIARSIGKHPKPNLPEEVEIQIEQLEVSNVESALYALEEGRNVLDQALAEAVSSDSKNRYEYANGKKPSGRGNWMFSTVHPREHNATKHKDQTVSVQGTFADAAKKAASHFKEKGHKGEIHVLS